jgi:hypothetical protein
LPTRHHPSGFASERLGALRKCEFTGNCETYVVVPGSESAPQGRLRPSPRILTWEKPISAWRLTRGCPRQSHSGRGR